MSREWLRPLDPVYGAAVAAKNSAYARGWFQAKRLEWPVVSVGNLSVGGSGKTPLTIRLAELLSADGFAVDVLSRGYGRSSRATERVDPEGSAKRFGDEPLLIARRAGVPVFVGASRYAAGWVAEGSVAEDGVLRSPHKPTSQRRDVGHPDGTKVSHAISGAPGLRVHLLDDGFQHRQLSRDLDVVVVHRSDFGAKLLPAGELREPLAALRRADFVVLRNEDAEFEGRLRQLGVNAPIWWMHRALELPEDLTATLERVVGFCGIARPEEFFSGLTRLGVNLEVTVTFADHHRYSRDDVERLAKTAREFNADAFVITEKDAVKLDPHLLAILEAVAPVRVSRLVISLRDEEQVVRQLREKLPARRDARKGP